MFPSVSSKKIKVPTVGMVNFGITILPPFASTAAIVWSMDETPIVHSNPNRLSGDDLPSLLQGALNARLFIRSSLDQKKARWTPRRKPPAQSFRIKAAGSVKVVGMDRKVFEIVRHPIYPSMS